MVILLHNDHHHTLSWSNTAQIRWICYLCFCYFFFLFAWTQRILCMNFQGRVNNASAIPEKGRFLLSDKHNVARKKKNILCSTTIIYMSLLACLYISSNMRMIGRKCGRRGFMRQKKKKKAEETELLRQGLGKQGYSHVRKRSGCTHDNRDRCTPHDVDVKVLFRHSATDWQIEGFTIFSSVLGEGSSSSAPSLHGMSRMFGEQMGLQGRMKRRRHHTRRSYSPSCREKHTCAGLCSPCWSLFKAWLLTDKPLFLPLVKIPPAARDHLNVWYTTWSVSNER